MEPSITMCACLAAARPLEQVLRDPAALASLSADEQATLRKQLSDAVELTAKLGTIDSTTAAGLVTALNAVVLSSSDMDDELFAQVLQLVRALAASAGDAAAALLNIVAAMLRSRGIASGDEARLAGLGGLR